jgi:uncharacterized membrane protein YadS
MAARHAGAGASKGLSAGTLAKAVPTFVLGFVAMAVVRSVGDAQLAAGGHAGYLLAASGWQRLTDLDGGFASTKLLLPMAMAGVGLSVQTKAFAGVGWRPFAVGAAGAALVGGTGLATALIASRVRRAALERGRAAPAAGSTPPESAAAAA